jgi:trans-aconitate 2-methyltransferase
VPPAPRYDAWDPSQYERFQAEREQPFHDLLGLIRRRPAERIVDLGCGTGALTALLHRELSARETIGVDSSEAMLARANQLTVPGLRFVHADITDFAPAEPVDLVFSNAALHWVADHTGLFPRLANMLTPAGELAVQVPANFDHPSHTVAAALASREPFAGALGGYERAVPVLAPEAYAELLNRLGFVEQHVRLQVYAHLLSATSDVVEWVRGSLLTDYEARMPEDLFVTFVARYRELLLATLGDRRPYFYAFKRILLWAKAP